MGSLSHEFAGHTFSQGMAEPSLLLDWAAKQLTGDEARAEAALALISSCLPELLSSQVHARRLAEALVGTTDGIALVDVFSMRQFPASLSPSQVGFVALASGTAVSAKQRTKLAGSRGRAVAMLRAAAAAAPSGLLTLDCLPQMAALCRGATIPPRSAVGGGEDPVERLLRRNAALTASVGARVLTYSDAVALRELERARVAGDAEAGSKQLLACMGESRYSACYTPRPQLLTRLFQAP